MQNKIKDLKQKIEENRKALHEKYKDNCQLLEPTLNLLNLLISYDAPDNTIKRYLKSMNSSIQIIEEKIRKLKI